MTTGYLKSFLMLEFAILFIKANIDFLKCRKETAASLNYFSNCWCKREHVDPDALKEWKINIF